jgi:hypothetical protein
MKIKKAMRLDVSSLSLLRTAYYLLGSFPPVCYSIGLINLDL